MICFFSYYSFLDFFTVLFFHFKYIFKYIYGLFIVRCVPEGAVGAEFNTEVKTEYIINTKSKQRRGTSWVSECSVMPR